MILGLDISSSCTGWSILDYDGKLITTGTIRPPKKYTHPAKLGYFETELQQVLDTYQPDLVGIEDIFKGPSQKVFKILALYHGVAYKTIFAHTGQDPVVMAPTQIRKMIGLKAKDKLTTFDFIVIKYKLKLSFIDNDITDAVAVGLALVPPKKKTGGI